MIKWQVKPTKELTAQDEELLQPIDRRSNYYIWGENDSKVLVSATIINLDAGLVLDFSNNRNPKYRAQTAYRAFGVISRIVDPKPAVILNPLPEDEDFYESLGFVKKGNTYTKTINL